MHFLPKLSKMTLHLGQDRDTPQAYEIYLSEVRLSIYLHEML